MPTITYHPETPCIREDLQMELTYSTDVDDLGQPLEVREGHAEDEPYWCLNCSDFFTTWEYALDHIIMQKEAR